MNEVKDALRQHREELLELLASLTSQDWETPVSDNESWTVRDTIAHVAGYQPTMAALVSSVISGSYTIEQGKQFRLDEHNAYLVSERRGASLNDLLRELAEGRTELMKVLERVQPEDWVRTTWRPGSGGAEGGTMTLRERLLRFAAHDSVHDGRIRATVNKPSP